MRPKIPLIVLSLALFLFFIYFSYLVAKERFGQFDFDTTVRLQDHIARRFDLPFSSLSILGSAEVTGLIWLGLTLAVLMKRFWLTALGLLLFLANAPIELFGKLFVFHPGPPFLFFRGVVNIQFPSQYLHTDYSYPSGHMTRVAFLLIFLFFLIYFRSRSPLKVVLELSILIFLALMAISRVYLGEHWTTDVIGGALIGGSLGTLSALTIPSPRKND